MQMFPVKRRRELGDGENSEKIKRQVVAVLMLYIYLFTLDETKIKF